MVAGKLKNKKRKPATEAAEDGEDEAEKAVKETNVTSKKKGKSETPAEEVVPAGTKKRKHDQTPVDRGSGISEDSRREVQRKIQQLVVRLKKEGKSQAEIDRAKYELKGEFGGSLRNPDSKRAKKSLAYHEKLQSKDAEEERKQNQQKKHDLVIIPVVWRGRHDQEELNKAAEEIKACVAQQGVDAWVDGRRQLKPGQKFAHWEFRGVMLRVEIGPEDLQAGVCRVCLAKEPGEYKSVERRKVPLPPTGARALLLALKELGLSKIDIERREGDSADEEDAAAVAASGGKLKKASGEDAVSADPELEGNWAPRTTPKAAKGKKSKLGGSKKTNK